MEKKGAMGLHMPMISVFILYDLMSLSMDACRDGETHRGLSIKHGNTEVSIHYNV